jgi:hypothetical protein
MSLDIVLRARPEMTVRFAPAPIGPGIPVLRLGESALEIRPIASAALRGFAQIAIALFLILVILPAALGAAGT